MQAKVMIYNKEEDKFEDYFFDYEWKHIVSPNPHGEDIANYYLYFRQIRDIYIQKGLKFNRNEIKKQIGNFYDEQYEYIRINH